MKRFLDILLSILAIIIISPLVIVVCLLIKLDSPGPIFYKGTRVGRKWKSFKIFKFRTMYLDAEKNEIFSTSENDNRITNVGYLLRRYKFDEFAQLINVLKGDMSLVGPRPEVKKFTDLFTDEEKIILTVRPGITDFASIEFRNEGEIIKESGINDPDEAYVKLIRPEKLRLQMKYVKEHNLMLDFKIILKTIKRVIIR